MMPAHLSEDMIRRCNLALWTHKDHTSQAEALMYELGQIMAAYGNCRFHRTTKVSPWRLTHVREGRLRIKPYLLTLLRILPPLGLRMRIELDPDPRHVLRPKSMKQAFEDKLEAMHNRDPTGRLASQALARKKAADERGRAYDLEYSRARRARLKNK